MPAYVPQNWVDEVTPADAAHMNYMEAGISAADVLARAALPTPAGVDGQFLKRVGGVWVPTSFAAGDIPAGAIDNAKVAAGAAIARSKLDFGSGLVNADVAANAAIANSKLAIPLITTSALSGGPPASPSDKDIWIATGVDANGTRWLFQYNAGSGSASKWEFIGGPPVMSLVQAQEATTSAAYTALTTAGPSITLARAGDYIIEIGADILENGSSYGLMSYDIGGTGASDNDWILVGTSATPGTEASAYRKTIKTGLVAATALVSKYRTTAGGAQVQFAKRFMAVTPIRIA